MLPSPSSIEIISLKNDSSANPPAGSGAVSKSESFVSPKGSLFSSSVISEHLKALGYPSKSLLSMEKCGLKNGVEIVALCEGCGARLIDMTYKCSLRTCPECSSIRKRRIRKRFMPYLSSLPHNRDADHLYFLTISPVNYKDFYVGLAHIKYSFKKFMRTKYIRERVKAGLYVIETKNAGGKGWNIHIHAVIYGRRLDNRIRGKCRSCHQNLLRFDYPNKRFYCANRKCNSLDVVHSSDSKIVSLFKQCSGGDCNLHISQLGSPQYTLNYMLKYISANKNDFDRPEDLAEYIYLTRKQKLLNVFGFFFKYKPPKEQKICRFCKGNVSYIWDMQIVAQIKSEQMRNPPPNLIEQLCGAI